MVLKQSSANENLIYLRTCASYDLEMFYGYYMAEISYQNFKKIEDRKPYIFKPPF